MLQYIKYTEAVVRKESDVGRCAVWHVIYVGQE